MMKMQGKVAIVTGGSAGIGQATAQLFARYGAHVVIADRDEVGGRETVRAIEAEGGRALFQRVDVSRDDDCAAMVEATLRHFGRLDIAFNNAGVSGVVASTEEQGLENWNRVIGVNLTGVFNCLVHELRAMRQHGGAIVNTASIAGVKGMAYGSAYCASKHGVIGLTRSAAREYGRHGIRINAVCPGFVNTAMASGLLDQNVAGTADKILSSAIMKRAAEPREAAELVLWLCSEKASFVTGAHYLVDGGLTT